MKPLHNTSFHWILLIHRLHGAVVLVLVW